MHWRRQGHPGDKALEVVTERGYLDVSRQSPAGFEIPGQAAKRV